MSSKAINQFNEIKEPEIDPQIPNVRKMNRTKSNPPSSDEEVNESDTKELKASLYILSQSPTNKDPSIIPYIVNLRFLVET